MNRIANGDTIHTSALDGAWEVRYISFSEGWVEVSDDDDTVRHIIPADTITHVEPLGE